MLSNLQNWTENEESNAEENSVHFNQQNYLWMFNEELSFDKRENFCIDEDISMDDYLQMTKLNRAKLCKYLREFNENK